MTRVLAQARVELTLTLRRGESVLLTLAIPLILLTFFSLVDVLPTGTDDPVDFLAPGVLALAVMSTAMVQVAIGTSFERQYGVLKRLGSTPLGRPALLTAKILATVAVEAVQVVLIVAVAVALGWDPSFDPGAAAALWLGTAAFGGLGLLLGGRLRGETTLAAANGLYLILLLLGGMVFSLKELPGAVRSLAHGLPASALAETLTGALSSGPAGGRAWVVLVAWAVAAPVVAAVAFRWE